MTNEQLDRIIAKYHVTIVGDRIHVVVPKSMSNAQASREIGSHKDDLMARIREVEAERKAGDARVAAIPMLAEVRKYRQAMADYKDARDKAWDAGEARWPSEPQKPEGDTTMADAYLALEAMSHASNYRKATAGRHGIEAVRSGEMHPDEALENARAEWQTCAKEAAWN